MNKILITLKNILIPLILGFLVGLVISNYMNYESMPKPFLAPPSMAFPIAWTILYALMGISYSILENNDILTKNLNKIYYLQLVVNLIWPILFFAFDLKLFSFLWILLLIILVCIMIKRFYDLNKLSGILQIPYLIWLFFAAYLNLAIYLLEMHII